MNKLLPIVPFFLILLSSVLYAEDKPFDCSLLKLNSAEQIVCMNKELSDLERKLVVVEKTAKEPKNKLHSPYYDLENRDWLKGRNECLSKPDEVKCLKKAYEARIAEIEARFRLVKSSGPFIYDCGKDLSGTLVVTFIQTKPPTLIAKNENKESFMIKDENLKEVKYEGTETRFWETKKAVLLVWGYDKPEMACQKLN